LQQSKAHTQVLELEPIFKLLKSCGKNAQTIIDYRNSLRNEIILSDNYERNNVNTLACLSKFHSNKKFKEMDKDDILLFLKSRKKSELEDPLHRWIATYNLYIITLARFFKWLYHPNLSPKDRVKPSCVDIPKLRRKEQSVYKPSDMWTQDDV
jgi:site-specific recombinase XerD